MTKLTGINARQLKSQLEQQVATVSINLIEELSQTPTVKVLIQLEKDTRWIVN